MVHLNRLADLRLGLRDVLLEGRAGTGDIGRKALLLASGVREKLLMHLVLA